MTLNVELILDGLLFKNTPANEVLPFIVRLIKYNKHTVSICDVSSGQLAVDDGVFSYFKCFFVFF